MGLSAPAWLGAFTTVRYDGTTIRYDGPDTLQDAVPAPGDAILRFRARFDVPAPTIVGGYVAGEAPGSGAGIYHDPARVGLMGLRGPSLSSAATV